MEIINYFPWEGADDTTGTCSVCHCRTDKNIFENLGFHFGQKWPVLGCKLVIFGTYKKHFFTPGMCFHIPYDEELLLFLQTDSFSQNKKNRLILR